MIVFGFVLGIVILVRCACLILVRSSYRVCKVVFGWLVVKEGHALVIRMHVISG